MSHLIPQEKISKEALYVTQNLQNAGFEAFVVGGCVRDLLIGKIPKDWDLTTNATPEDIQKIFGKTIYENVYGTVGVCVTYETDGTPVSRDTTGADYIIIEVTPYRTEGKYTDSRHPETVSFTNNIEDDLSRRDFTINAMAYDPYKGHLIDLYKGQQDIKDKVIRAVGDPDKRFKEDALRMIRAIRFTVQLGFTISHETHEALFLNKDLLKSIAIERVRDEFNKIILSDDPMMGIILLEQLQLLEYLIPELREGIGCEQKGEHIYDVFLHMLHALQFASKKDWPLEIRLAALFHDIGKPRTRRWDGTKAGGKGKYTFYGHEVVGARMTTKILSRLKYSNEVNDFVTLLVRYHMFFSDTEQITLSAVRRLIQRVGSDNIWKLMDLRDCDRAGMNKKEGPYRLRKFHSMIEEAMRAPTSVGMLKIDGQVLIQELGIAHGPRMGWILHALLEECLEDDTKNTLEYLKSRSLILNTLDDEDLRKLGVEGREAKDEREEEELREIRKKYKV